MPEFFRLTGGAFVSLAGDTFIPIHRTSENVESREVRIINGRILLGEIREIVRRYKELESSKKEIPKALSARLRLAEFFMLTVRCLIDLKNRDSNIRLQNEPIYFRKFGASAKNMVFDITMPFFNVVYPKDAYCRFGNDIYKYAVKDPSSLLNRMTDLNLREKDNRVWALMSMAAIRNMEILEDLTDWLHNRRVDDKVSGSSMEEVLRSFYSQFDYKKSSKKVPEGKYCVKTYGKIDDEKDRQFYYIDYAVYSCLGDVISELDMLYDGESQMLNERKNLFDGIFDYNAIIADKDEYPYQEVREILSQYINPSVLIGYIGRDKGKRMSHDELAQILSEMRVNSGYEFDTKLPVGLRLKYRGYMENVYKTMRDPIEEEKTTLDAQYSDLLSHQDGLNDNIRQINTEIIQYKKDLKKIRVDVVKAEAKENEQKDNLEYLQKQLFEESEPKEKSRLKKEMEKLVKAVNAASALLAVQLMTRSITESQLKDSQKNMDKLAAEAKKVKTEIRDIEKKISKVRKKLEEFDSNFSNAHTID